MEEKTIVRFIYPVGIKKARNEEYESDREVEEDRDGEIFLYCTQEGIIAPVRCNCRGA